MSTRGQIWVCKTAHDLYGEDAELGWDASCVCNAILCYEHNLYVQVGETE